jgi:hypothetical protein
MNITQSVAMALVQLSSLPRSENQDSALSLPSPEHSDYDAPAKTVAMKFPRKRLPGNSTEREEQHVATEDDLQLKIGTGFLNLSETAKIHRIAGFRMLTSIISPALLPWNIMCLTNLRACTINVEVERCAYSNFSVPYSAVIPSCHAGLSRIERLVAQIPIEFLNIAVKTGDIFEYLPTLVQNAPHLRSLALQLTRKEGRGACPDDGILRSYDALLRDVCSQSLETLIIDTCDIEHAAVRQCPNDFFETIYPIISLQGLRNLHRIVAPQEAFIRVDDSLFSDSTVNGVAPTTLLSSTIQRVEIIDSTTALDS